MRSTPARWALCCALAVAGACTSSSPDTDDSSGSSSSGEPMRRSSSSSGQVGASSNGGSSGAAAGSSSSTGGVAGASSSSSSSAAATSSSSTGGVAGASSSSSSGAAAGSSSSSTGGVAGASSSSSTGGTASTTGTSSSSSTGGASSSSSSSGGTGTSSSSSGGSTSSSGMCGTAGEGIVCAATSECECGLECIGGGCFRAACSTPGQQGSCEAGYTCVDIGTANACVPVGGPGEFCGIGLECSSGQTCQISQVDAQGDVVFDTATCRQECAYGAANPGCGMGERCLPSTEGFFTVQQSADGGVGCTLGSDTGCDTANGFSCVNLSSGPRCAREVGACGTATPLADFSNPDGGNRPIPLEEICNLGPRVTDADGGVVVEANRFCDDYATLQNPPAIECVDVFGGQLIPGLGACIATCSFRDSTGALTFTADCPNGSACDLDTGLFPTVAGGSSNPTACTTTADCSSLPNSVCMDVIGDTGGECVYPRGLCQPSTTTGGTTPEEAPCTETSECQSGLQCLAGLCLSSCLTPGEQSNCTMGQSCVALTSGDNVCVTQAGRYEDCSLADCTTGLDCRVGFLDVSDAGVFAGVGSLACQQPCDRTATNNGCAAGELCLPSSEGLVERQSAETGGISCTVGNNTPCDTVQGYRCLTLSNGAFCAREMRACGTPVPPVDLRAPGDGGPVIIPDDRLCNLGSLFPAADGGVAINGGRFCNTYETLQNPPVVECDTTIFNPVIPGLGACMAYCDSPPPAGGVPGTLSCPTGYSCQAVNNGFILLARNANNQTVPCTADSNCSAFAGATCVNTTGGQLCAFPARQCTPN